MRYTLSDASHGLPCNGELYMCVDRTPKRKLHLELALFYPTLVAELKKEQSVTLFVYNSLVMVGHDVTVGE